MAIVTTLTLTLGAGRSMANALTALAAGVPVRLKNRGAKWYRIG